MPIYAYRCAACGHAQDVLQKMSDPVLTVCPACGAEAYTKQVTAAGFQLKGSGWYVTDFRGGNNAAKKDAKVEGGDKPADKAADKPADKGGEQTPAKSSDNKPAEKSADGKSATAASAAPPAPSPPPSSSGS